MAPAAPRTPCCFPLWIPFIETAVKIASYVPRVARICAVLWVSRERTNRSYPCSVWQGKSKDLGRVGGWGAAL